MRYLFTGIACIAIAACAAEQPANAVQQQARPQAPAAAAPAPDAEAEVRTFLDQIYAPYRSRDGSPADLVTLVEPRLAEAMRRDSEAARARDDMGRLDYDPLMSGQDYEPFRATFGDIAVRGEQASATVRFTNGRPITLALDLLRTPAGWRIADLREGDNVGLRELYELPALR